MLIYQLSIILSIISATPISEKMPKTADEETETYAEEETEDESFTPTLVCTFLRCIFKVFLIMCWLRRRLPQTQGRWRRQRAPMKRTCSSLSRKRTTRRRRAGVVARGPGLPTGGTVPADGLQWSRLQWRRARSVMRANPGRPALTKSRVEYYLVLQSCKKKKYLFIKLTCLKELGGIVPDLVLPLFKSSKLIFDLTLRNT